MTADLTAEYRHIAKRATAGEPIVRGGAMLKFYTIAPADLRVPAGVAVAARACVAGIGTDLRGDDRGFVILHRCGVGFYFLLISVWRGANELWEAVYYNAPGGFVPFGPAYPAAGVVRPTFCVWELGVVGHEARAWAEFLRSPRAAGDERAWQQSLFDGDV